MAPLPFVPLANTLPGVAIDGVVIGIGYLFTLVSTAYVGVLMVLVIHAGMHAGAALDLLRRWWEQLGAG